MYFNMCIRIEIENVGCNTYIMEYYIIMQDFIPHICTQYVSYALYFILIVHKIRHVSLINIHIKSVFLIYFSRCNAGNNLKHAAEIAYN